MPRLLCLDGLRGLLASYVLVSHLAPFLALPPPLDRVAAAASHGTAAVDMFFVLSGLVIMGSLDSFAWQPLPFLIARASRIFPVFLVVFAASIGVEALPDPLPAMPWVAADSLAHGIWSTGWPAAWGAHVLAHLTMTHGLLPDGSLPYAWVSFLGASWSLSTEWQFYALMALAAARMGRAPVPPLRLAALFLALAASGAAWAAFAPPPLRFSRAFLPNKAQYFALGIVSAAMLPARAGPGEAASAGSAGGARRARPSAAYLVVLAATLALSTLQPGGAGKLLPPLVWTACLAAQLLPDRRFLRPLAAALAAKPLLWLGALSYPLYLVNEPIQKLLGVGLAGIAGGDGALFDLGFLPGSVLLPLAAAWWLHHAVERPALRWGRAIAAGRGRPAGDQKGHGAESFGVAAPESTIASG